MDNETSDGYIIKAPPLNYEPRGGIGEELFRAMRKNKDKIAQYIVDTEEEETYYILLEKCIRTSLKLRSEGISSSDIVCMCTYNHRNTVVPFMASMFLGIKVASLDPSMSVQDVSYLLKQVKPAILFFVPEVQSLIEKSIEEAHITCKLVAFDNEDFNNEYQKFEEYLEPNEEEHTFKPVPVSTEDTAVIFFSSGTTGLPKGICQSHYALLGQAVNVINNGSMTSVSLLYSSLYWISSVLFTTATILAGQAKVICKKFDPHQVWTIIDRYKVSFLFLAPSQALDMFKAGRPDNISTSSLLTFYTGGGTFSEKHLTLLRDLLPGTFISQGYGQTEVAGVLTIFKMNDVNDAVRLHYKPNSCGRPINGIWYKVVDPETEKTLGPNQRGELRVRTRFAMNGYYNLDSSKSFDSSGWLKTGDIVYYDDDLCFYVVDRIKEMLKFRSWHIAPTMLENIIDSHPAIRKSVVIGIPDEDDGDLPMAIVVLNNPEAITTAEEIERFVAERVQDRQRIRAGVKFVKSFPLTPSGKIKRHEIKKMVLAGEI